MKNLDSFIIEKLKINKDTINNQEVDFLTDLYNSGDVCLLLHERGSKNQFVTIDAVRLEKVNKKLIKYEYLSHACIPEFFKNGEFSVERRININTNQYECLMYGGGGSISILVPNDKCKDVINKIYDNDYKIDIGNIYMKMKSKNEYNVNVVQAAKEDSFIYSFGDTKPITTEKMNEIEKCF